MKSCESSFKWMDHSSFLSQASLWLTRSFFFLLISSMSSGIRHRRHASSRHVGNNRKISQSSSAKSADMPRKQPGSNLSISPSVWWTSPAPRTRSAASPASALSIYLLRAELPPYNGKTPAGRKTRQPFFRGSFRIRLLPAHPQRSEAESEPR